MLERLMNNDLYERDEKTGKFNEKYLTQLTKNYRSHISLLNVSNELFYENTLETCADSCKFSFFFFKETLKPIIVTFCLKKIRFSAVTDWFIDTKFLKSPQFPMIFHSIEGTSSRNGRDPR